MFLNYPTHISDTPISDRILFEHEQQCKRILISTELFKLRRNLKRDDYPTNPARFASQRENAG